MLKSLQDLFNFLIRGKEKELLVNTKRLYEDAKLPQYSTEGAVGLDLYSYEDYVLKPGERHKFQTGIAMEIPFGYGGFIWPRSGLDTEGKEKKAGVIDPDYRGEIKVTLWNGTAQSHNFLKGDKIAQMVIHKVPRVRINEVKELSKTSRGVGGFGSSGR